MNALLSHLLHGVAIGCGFALVASGLILIYRVTRVVNLAQGTFGVLAGFSTASLVGSGLPHGLAEFIGVLCAAVAGFVTGVVAIGKRGTGPQASLIATLGVAIFAYAVEILVWGDQPRSFPGVAGTVDIPGLHLPTQYVLVVAVTLLTFVALEAFFERSYYGKAMSACASNPFAATLVGIGVRRMGLLAFALAGALGGMAGVLLTPLAPISYDSDMLLFVNGFASAILAGLTRPVLALSGGIGLGVAQALVAGYAKASYQSSLALLLALAILVVQGLRHPAIHSAEES